MSPVADCLAAAEALGGDLVADLCELVAIPSVGGSPAEQDVQRWLAARLAGLGADVATWRTPMTELAADPAYPGAEVQRDALVGVLARIAGSSPGSTLLVGHTDVVPPAGWSDAFAPRVDGDCVVGRGAADMKGGVAAMLHVARVLQRTGAVPVRSLLIAGVSAEEDGGAGAFDLTRRLHDLPVACLVPEPTSGDVVVANAGALGFRITVHGRSAHAAARWEGVDAMAAATAVHTALTALERDLAVDPDPLLAACPIPHPTSIGTVAGGDWASTVMSSVTMTGRYGIPLGGDVTALRRRFEDTVGRAARSAHPDASAEVVWEGGQFEPARQDPDHPAVQRLVRSATAVAGAPRIRGTTYGSDLRLLLAAGIPTMLYGPGDTDRAHTAGESVSVPDLVRATQVLLRWVLD